MKREILLIRADACTHIGMGHIMRMIALAQAWNDVGGDVVFLCAEIPPSLESRLDEEGCRVERISAVSGSRDDLSATCAAIERYTAGALIPVVLDGYQFDSLFQRGLKAAGCRLLVMDDHAHANFYHADWVLNPNMADQMRLYRRRAVYTKLLRGIQFALLRREFLCHRNRQRDIPEVARNVLLTLGGADPENVSKKVIDAILDFDINVKVVVGAINPHSDELHQLVAESAVRRARVELVENPKDMPWLMSWADLAISACGGTIWELALLGVPSVFLVLAQNQTANGRAVEAMGLGVVLSAPFGKAELAKMVALLDNLLGDWRIRREFSERCRASVDGLGARKLVSVLRDVR